VKGRATPVTAYKIACSAGLGPASNSTFRMGGLCLRARPH
jgi:hypothetical protein